MLRLNGSGDSFSLFQNIAVATSSDVVATRNSRRSGRSFSRALTSRPRRGAPSGSSAVAGELRVRSNLQFDQGGQASKRHQIQLASVSGRASRAIGGFFGLIRMDPVDLLRLLGEVQHRSVKKPLIRTLLVPESRGSRTRPRRAHKSSPASTLPEICSVFGAYKLKVKQAPQSIRMTAVSRREAGNNLPIQARWDGDH